MYTDSHLPKVGEQVLAHWSDDGWYYEGIYIGVKIILVIILNIVINCLMSIIKVY